MRNQKQKTIFQFATKPEAQLQPSEMRSQGPTHIGLKPFSIDCVPCRWKMPSSAGVPIFVAWHVADAALVRWGGRSRELAMLAAGWSCASSRRG